MGDAAAIPEAQACDEATPLCPHCVKAVSSYDHFCPSCGGPITSHATTDPLGSIFAAGHVYANATSPRRKPRFVMLLGMWLLFASQIGLAVIALALIVDSLLPADLASYSFYFPVYDAPAPVDPTVFRETYSGSAFNDGGDPLYAVFGLVVMLGQIALYSVILWKVTTQYRRAGLETEGLPDDSPHAPPAR